MHLSSGFPYGQSINRKTFGCRAIVAVELLLRFAHDGQNETEKAVA
jgi:hypothetical protein